MPPLRTTTFVAKPASPVAEAKPTDPFFILGCVFVGVSMFCSLLAYGYGIYLKSQITQMSGEVMNIEKSLEGYPLNDMLTFGNKVLLIEKLLKNHTYPTTILSALSDSVEKGVYYSSFNLSYQPGVGHRLSLSAIAQDYASVAKQMDELKNTEYGKLFKSVQMTSLGKDSFGNKMFDIQIDVAGSLKEDEFTPSFRSSGVVDTSNIVNTNQPSNTTNNNTVTQPKVGTTPTSTTKSSATTSIDL